MQITYELTERDFLDGYAAHRKSRMAWGLFKIFIGIVLLFTVVILFGFLMKPSWEQARALMPLFVVVPMWIALVALYPRWSVRRQFRQQPGAHGPRTATLDDTGAHWRWNGGASDVEWKNYIRSVEGKNHFLFYISPAFFNILPKRALSADQLVELRSLLNQNIGIRK